MTITVAGWEFAESEAVLACRHSLEGEEVFGVLLDADGDLIASCELMEHDSDDWRAIHVVHLVELHPDLGQLPDLAIGQAAERATPNGPWSVAEYTVHD